MMTTEHDEALVERVALAIANEYCIAKGWKTEGNDIWAHTSEEEMRAKARAVIYPTAPPKTRLQVATDIWREAGGMGKLIHDTVAGKAILAALALPAMDE